MTHAIFYTLQTRSACAGMRAYDCTHQMEKTARVEWKGKNYKKLNISRTKRAEMNEIISISIAFGELLFGDKK